jgi:hypothetical protein
MKLSCPRGLYRVTCSGDWKSSAGKDSCKSDFGLFSKLYCSIRGLTIKFANSPLCACRGSSGQKLSMVWWLWHISFPQLCCFWSMAISFWVASIIVWMCFGVLHHDNAPAHTALSVREFLASKQITVLEHPPYSPDLASNYFFVFPNIKEIDIRNNTTAALKVIPQNQFQNCFEGWTRRWYRCITSQGEYFDGDHSDIQQWGMYYITITSMSSRNLLSDHLWYDIVWYGVTYFFIVCCLEDSVLLFHRLSTRVFYTHFWGKEIMEFSSSSCCVTLCSHTPIGFTLLSDMGFRNMLSSQSYLNRSLNLESSFSKTGVDGHITLQY